MDGDALKAMFDRHDDEYLHFERIPEGERLHPNRTLCAYLKVASLLVAGPVVFAVAAEHDVVYLADAGCLREVTDDDVVYLLRAGIHYDEELDALADFC